MSVRHDAYGYDQDFDAPEPTAILICEYCAAEIPITWGETIAALYYTIGEYELVACECGAVFGEGDTLEVKDD